jgi:hypothetical protein
VVTVVEDKRVRNEPFHEALSTVLVLQEVSSEALLLALQHRVFPGKPLPRLSTGL